MESAYKPAEETSMTFSNQVMNPAQGTQETAQYRRHWRGKNKLARRQP